MSTYSALVIADTPSLYWTLDAATGATDQSGNGRNGTGVGGVSIGGFAGSPLYGETTSTTFNGTTHTITSTYAPFTNGTVRTYEGWANRVSNGASHCFAGGSGTYPNNAFILLNVATQNFQLYLGATPVTWTAAWPNVGLWNHWALVFDETGNSGTLYINGRLVSSQSVTDPYDAGSGNIKVGSEGVTDFWGGQLAHVAVYEYGLTATQVSNHYQTGVGAFAPRSFTPIPIMHLH